MKSFKEYLKDNSKEEKQIISKEKFKKVQLFGASHNLEPKFKKVQLVGAKHNLKEAVNNEVIHNSEILAHPTEEERKEHYKLSKSVSPSLKKSSDEDIDTLHKYTRGSAHYNKALFHAAIGKTHNEEHLGLAKHISDVISKHTIHAPKGITLHTGTHFNPAEHSEGEGKHIHLELPAITSTSTSAKTASNFGQNIMPHKNDVHHGVDTSEGSSAHIISIHVKPGQKVKGVSLAGVSSFGGDHPRLRKEGKIEFTGKHKDSEHEVALPAGTRLRVHPVPTIHHKRNGKSGDFSVHQWHAEIVDQ